jgi:membrane associated rhomboid family serine protease
MFDQAVSCGAMNLPPPPPPRAPTPASPGALTCYRHPNREAGRRCTRCGKPACTDCLVQASVGSHCIDCARLAKPDTKTRARYWSARQSTLVTYVLIATNLAVFIYLVLQTPASIGGDTNALGYVRLGLLRDWLDNDFAPGLPDGLPGQWYRLVSSGFLHYGILHLAFNMYALWALGQTLEPMLGRVRFTLVYFACLLGGSAGALLLQPNGLHGGASGAVFGLFGLIIVGYLQRGINPLTTSLGGILIINVLDLSHPDRRRHRQHRCGSRHNDLTPPGISQITSVRTVRLGELRRNFDIPYRKLSCPPRSRSSVTSSRRFTPAPGACSVGPARVGRSAAGSSTPSGPLPGTTW